MSGSQIVGLLDLAMLGVILFIIGFGIASGILLLNLWLKARRWG